MNQHVLKLLYSSIVITNIYHTTYFFTMAFDNNLHK